MATTLYDEIDDEIDELDELIAERTQQNPDFAALVEAALQRRRATRAKPPTTSAADDYPC